MLLVRALWLGSPLRSGDPLPGEPDRASVENERLLSQEPSPVENEQPASRISTQRHPVQAHFATHLV
jgi:hypothetical protein